MCDYRYSSNTMRAYKTDTCEVGLNEKVNNIYRRSSYYFLFFLNVFSAGRTQYYACFTQDCTQCLFSLSHTHTRTMFIRKNCEHRESLQISLQTM